MSKPIELSIIIPAYNEEKKIKVDVRKAFSFLKKYLLHGEVIVSTDGITDGTNEIVKNLQRSYKNLHLLSKKDKIGKGAAIKMGMEIAEGKIIMFADAGICVPYKNALQGISLLRKGFDCAMGSRAIAGSKILKEQPLYRKIGSKIFSFIVHTIIQVPDEIEDTQCGFKLFKKEVVKQIFSQLKTSKMMFDIEVILRLTKGNYKIASFPVEWKNDEDTKFNPVTGSVQNLVDLFLIKVVYRL